jgi:hypothetical protein
MTTKFQWDDPFRLDDQLSGDERAAMSTRGCSFSWQ